MKVIIKIKRGRRDGSILIIGMTVLAFLLVFAVPHLFQQSPENKVTDKSANYAAAFSLAEAGIERVVWELNYGDISTWKGDSTSRTLIISSYQAPASEVIGDIEIRVEDPDGDNPRVKSIGRVAYTSPLAEGKAARVYLERTATAELEREGYNWVCSFPQKQIPAPPVQGSTF
jgi:type II secretory pathway pseudopilin PulG